MRKHHTNQHCHHASLQLKIHNMKLSLTHIYLSSSSTTLYKSSVGSIVILDYVGIYSSFNSTLSFLNCIATQAHTKRIQRNALWRILTLIFVQFRVFTFWPEKKKKDNCITILQKRDTNINKVSLFFTIWNTILHILTYSKREVCKQDKNTGIK